MSTQSFADLAATVREADRLTDVADALANDGQHRRAASTYSKALGIVMDAIDTVLAAEETAA